MNSATGFAAPVHPCTRGIPFILNIRPPPRAETFALKASRFGRIESDQLPSITMSFFKETLKARLYQNKAKYPLLKLDDLLDLQLIGDKLRRARARSRSDRRGNSGYDPLKMFKAVLLGQWHSLSDPELKHALAVRADFLVFCDFDDKVLSY